MKSTIKEKLQHPDLLEDLYQRNKKQFQLAFDELYPEIEDQSIAKVWHTRLHYKKEKQVVTFRLKEVLLLIIISLFAGFLAKIPEIFSLDILTFHFYEKNIALILVFGISLFAMFISKANSWKITFFTLLIFAGSALYLNLLPSNYDSQIIHLVYLHLPLLLWFLFGWIYVGFDRKDLKKRMAFIQFNGDFIIMCAILMLASGIFTGITLGLFYTIDLDIEEFYFEWIAIIGGVSLPIVAYYMLHKMPTLTAKIAPVVANIFSPVVLVMLTIYLVSIVITGKDPYGDREFLLTFNALLMGVMAIILFSVSEKSSKSTQKVRSVTLFLLSILTLVINLIALSAIVYRLSEYGFTPNRVAVTGFNLVSFINLILISMALFKAAFKGKPFEEVGCSTSKFIPVYIIWLFFVVAIMPLIFSF